MRGEGSRGVCVSVSVCQGEGVLLEDFTPLSNRYFPRERNNLQRENVSLSIRLTRRRTR